ncbi:MAG: hypothetical protein AAGA26_08600, partial [Pseudomonadota bacterium]
MSDRPGMIRAGGLILLVAGALGLGAALDPSAAQQAIERGLGTVGFPDARPMLLDLVAGTMIALGLDFALCAVIVTGQLVLGLGMAL